MSVGKHLQIFFTAVNEVFIVRIPIRVRRGSLWDSRNFRSWELETGANTPRVCGEHPLVSLSWELHKAKCLGPSLELSADIPPSSGAGKECLRLCLSCYLKPEIIFFFFPPAVCFATEHHVSLVLDLDAAYNQWIL